MGSYISADTIRMLRDRRGITQRALADRVGVTDKAVSKWETGRGLPDASLVEPLAAALGVSVAELFSGEVRVNGNRSGNVLRSSFSVCPVCGNVIYSLGAASLSCCGVALPPLEAEEPDLEGPHAPAFARSEDDWLISIDHPMEKDHFISFVSLVTMDGMVLRKLYPEQPPRVRIPALGSGFLYVCCNRHGLFRVRTPRRAVSRPIIKKGA